jgi:uncharacterized protein YndB with AHSA1/START domain
MATTRRTLGCSRDAVWRVLSDGNTYSRWVVGTSSIRAVDDAWPAVGSRLHYRIGRGPLTHDGHTEVLAMTPGSRLELEAHAWPLGTARIELLLADRDGHDTVGQPGCEVTMVEHPARGTAALLHNPLGDGLLKLRNVEALRRLERLCRLDRPAASDRQ